MALALVRCSIEADQGGTPHARPRVNLVSWKGRSHALLFMVPLGLPSVRPMAQALQLPFEYYIYIYIIIIIIIIIIINIIIHQKYSEITVDAYYKKFSKQAEVRQFINQLANH